MTSPREKHESCHQSADRYRRRCLYGRDRRGLRVLQRRGDQQASNWSAIWYMLSAFAVISYTDNAAYVAFAALGSWLGAFASVTWLHRGGSLALPRHDPP
jgi:hypothetical protein